MIEILHIQKRIEKENQSGTSPIPAMFLSLFLAALLPPPLVQRVPRIIDVKRVFVLHAGILCKSPPLLIESQLVTQPAEINNIAAIMKLIIVSLTNCTINFRCGNYTFDRLSSIRCKQCKTETLIWGSQDMSASTLPAIRQGRPRNEATLGSSDNRISCQY